MIWLTCYLAIGLLLFVTLIYLPVSQRPPDGWWLDRSYWMASAVIVVCWPIVLVAWICKRP